MATEPRRRWTAGVPWALMIGGDGVAVWRGYLAAWWYREWLTERAFDPTGAELDLVNAQTEAAFAVAALAVAGAGIVLLLRTRRRQRRERALAGDA